MKENVIGKKSFDFALDIIQIYKVISTERKEYVLSKQLLRSGTSIGANIREAKFGESKADFIHKMAIALKEANETEYWLELLNASGYISEAEFSILQPKIIEQLKLLTSIINTTKNKNY